MQSEKENRLNKSYTLPSGITATCSEYRSANSVTVTYSNGETRRTNWFAFKNGIEPPSVTQGERSKKASMSLKRPATDHKGNTYPCVEDMCKAYGIRRQTYQHRLRCGMSQEEALTTDKRGLWYHGKHYPNIKSMCDDVDIPYNAYVTFLYRCKEKVEGLSVEERVELFKQQKKGDYIAPNGRTYSCEKEYCDEIGIDAHAVYSRRSHGHRSAETLFSKESLMDMKYAVSDHKGNHYRSQKAMCSAYGVTYGSFKYWISKGMSVEYALTHERKELKCTDHTGQEYESVTEMCRSYGISRALYNQRIRRGMNQKEALETPKKRFNVVTDHLGNEYRTVEEMCEKYGIKHSLYNNRMRRGLSQEEALTAPVKATGNSAYIVPGYRFMTLSGLAAEVVAVGSPKVLVRTEDGTEFEVFRQDIGTGKVLHPRLRRAETGEFMGFSAKYIAHTGEKTFYDCECLMCGMKELMTPHEMMEHGRKHGIA